MQGAGLEVEKLELKSVPYGRPVLQVEQILLHHGNGSDLATLTSPDAFPPAEVEVCLP